MVTLPGSFAQVGWFEGILLLATSGVVAASSLVLLNVATNVFGDSEASKTSSYAGLVAHVLGNFGSQTLELLTLLYCVGQIVAYLGAVGQQFALLMGYIFGFSLSIHKAIAVVAFFFMFPFSLLPEQGAMRFAGALGTACMVYIVAAVVFRDGISAIRNGVCSLSVEDGDGSSSDSTNVPMSFSSSFTTMLKNMPIFLFSMNASVTYVPVRYHHRKSLFLSLLLRNDGENSSSYDVDPQEHRKSVERESSRLIGSSISIAGFFYLACSGVAYLAYCNGVPENVIDAWPLSWLPGLLARIFLSIELTVAAAGIYVPLGRAAFWHLRYGPYQTIAPAGLTRILTTLAIIGVGAIGSIALGGALALPLAVTSALCVTAQMFVLPGLCIAQLSADSAAAGGGHLIPGGSSAGLTFAVAGAAFGTLSLAALFDLI